MGALIEQLFFNNNWPLYSYQDIFSVSNERNNSLLYDSILSASQEWGMIKRNDINIDIKYDLSTIKNYKVVKKGDYVLHLRSFQGGLAYSTLQGICSPAYTILRPNKLIYKSFLKHFFMSDRFIKSLRVVTYGIRDGRSINTEEFMKLKVCIPEIAIQVSVTEFFNKLDIILSGNKKYNELLNKQKRYLLKNLFI